MTADAPDTNILVVNTRESGMKAKDVADAAAKHGVLYSVISPYEMRAVTHYEVDDAGIKRAIDALKATFEGRSGETQTNAKLTYG